MIQTAPSLLRPSARGKTGSGRYLRYFIIFATPMLLAALVGSGLYTFLEKSGETLGPIAAAHRQAETGEKYASALTYRPFAFKFERYRMEKPEILIVGSSRVMGFAGEAFTTSVFNSGGAANTIEEADAFIEAAMAVHRPKSILLGLDFWWFNPNRDDEINTGIRDTVDIRISLTQLMAPIEWMAIGQVSPKKFFAAILPGYQAPVGIGALAQFSNQGWDRYGRFDYGGLFDGTVKGEDDQFARTLERVRNAKASSKFNVAVMPSEKSINLLNAIVERIRSQGIEVVLLLPPVALPILGETTDKPDDVLLPAWETAVRNTGVPVIDAQNPAELGSDQCEFVDGFHGGEVTYLRILERIANMDELFLASAINRPLVNSLIISNAGNARIAELRPIDAAPEVDFLSLGCAKL